TVRLQLYRAFHRADRWKGDGHRCHGGLSGRKGGSKRRRYYPNDQWRRQTRCANVSKSAPDHRPKGESPGPAQQWRTGHAANEGVQHSLAIAGQRSRVALFPPSRSSYLHSLSDLPNATDIFSSVNLNPYRIYSAIAARCSLVVQRKA